MAFTSQFALTLELTKLIPLDVIVHPAANAILSLARRLQNTGSNLIIEQDLAELFGRARIEKQLESSFRSEVAKSSSIFLDHELRLVGGPGPTVGRALKERPYFATVVQLSLLASVHETGALAQGITSAIEKKFAEAPSDQKLAPSQHGIHNSLNACEEQTSAYNWTGHIQAVGATLGLSVQEIGFGMQPTILSGLMDMLPIVQQLPEDRMMHCQGKDGVCVIVVWAHHVLGLTVIVKISEADTLRFGNGTNPEVFIDATASVHCIALYDCSAEPHTELILLKPDIDETPIESHFKMPLKGFGTVRMNNSCSFYSTSEALLEDMVAITIAMAMLLGRKLEDHRSIESQTAQTNLIV